MTVEKLNAALAKANGEVPAPKKTKTNPHFRSKYADIADVEAAVRPVWATHGLSWRYHITTEAGHLVVALIVLHESGATLHLPGIHAPAPGNPQHLISATTYFRRVVLSAAAGVSADDDDDGNAATDPGAGEPHTTQTPRPRGAAVSSPTTPSATSPAPDTRPKQGPTRDNPMTDAQRRRLWATARAHGYGAKPELAAFACGLLEYEFDVERLTTLTKAEASKVIDALQAVEVAERESPAEPPDDPWATAEQPTL